MSIVGENLDSSGVLFDTTLVPYYWKTAENLLGMKNVQIFKEAFVYNIHSLDKGTSNQTNPISSIPYHSLSKKERTKMLHNELCKISKKQQRLKELIEDSVDVHGVTLGGDLHNDFREVIKECEAQLEGETPSSFKWVFWQHQMEASHAIDSRGMRWHPLMIKWCIYLRHQSQVAHETLLRQSKCVSLPSQCTLRDYKHHVKATNGFSAEVDMQLCQVANLKSSTAIDQYVILLLDEMHIKESLVYDKHTGDLIGFTDLGDINSHILALEQSLTDSRSYPPTCIHSNDIRG